MPLPVVRRPPAIAADDPRKFSIKSGRVRAIKTSENGNDRYFIEGTASSSVRDRHGDTLTDAAQLSMLDQTRDLTMWLNHSYEVPEDILGTCGESSLEKEVDPTFGPCIDLNIRCEVYATNPRAMAAWTAVNSGVKLAFSIGGYFLDVALDEDEDALDQYWFPCIVNDVALLEISLVGIPANPRAYTKGLDTGMLPYMLESLRESVKSAGDTREKRYAFAKSLFGGSDMFCKHVGCTEIKARGVEFCDQHKDAELPADPPATNGAPAVKDDGGEMELSAEHQLRCLAAMTSMKDAVGHGMCQDALTQIKNAHAQVKSMMPDDYAYDPDNDPSEIGVGTQNAAPVGHTCVAAGTNPETVVNAAAELEQLSSAAAQRAAEVADLEARKAALQAENVALEAAKTALHSQIEQLKATPTGRQTAKPGRSYNGASYQPQTQTLADASKRLGAALAGAPVGDPALRPA